MQASAETKLRFTLKLISAVIGFHNILYKITIQTLCKIYGQWSPHPRPKVQAWSDFYENRLLLKKTQCFEVRIFWPTWPMLTKPIQDRAPELKSSPPGFLKIPGKPSQTPGSPQIRQQTVFFFFGKDLKTIKIANKIICLLFLKGRREPR